MDNVYFHSCREHCRVWVFPKKFFKVYIYLLFQLCILKYKLQHICGGWARKIPLKFRNIISNELGLQEW